jgi:hypothetical protein
MAQACCGRNRELSSRVIETSIEKRTDVVHLVNGDEDVPIADGSPPARSRV